MEQEIHRINIEVTHISEYKSLLISILDWHYKLCFIHMKFRMENKLK